jgi:mannose-6-phosphate isomerase
LPVVVFLVKALTEYEGLCGFRPISEIKEYLKNVPEFAAIVGDAASSLMQSSGKDDFPNYCRF